MANMYIGSLIDFDRSIVMYPEQWTKIQNQINEGENVILFANHQSEGDAAFIPLLTEVSHPGLCGW
jgi:glycerol-3-phosphate O-acyltransferase